MKTFPLSFIPNSTGFRLCVHCKNEERHLAEVKQGADGLHFLSLVTTGERVDIKTLTGWNKLPAPRKKGKIIVRDLY